ncbi:MAG: ribonuclease VapC [Candidatus Bathyarchaeota archaeon]|nr:ribonuclease VapC [Candidatus Bathyarchaeota archaeon]
MNRKVIVLDTSAFVAGFDPFSISEEQYTVPMVREEIFGSSMSWVRFKTAMESGKLKVKMPEENFLNKVKVSANVIGDAFFLSDADLQVLALALELKSQGCTPLVATDDYSIQNVANQMGIPFASLATFGIRFRLQWIRYCPACHKRYPANYKYGKCEICGTELKRKPLRKKSLDQG